MCGIYASISTDGFKNPSTLAKEFLCNRGPDHIGESHTQLSLQDGKSYWISLISTVLALRGGYVTAQPFKDYHSDSLLCWNGEAWKIGTEKVTGNDGQAIFDALVRASLAQVTSKSSDGILNVLRSIAGPFAFVFVDSLNKQIYFGRDRLGRRSLLYKHNQSSTSLEFASIADPASGLWNEVEADAVYQLSCDGSGPVETHQGILPDLLSRSIAPTYMHPWNAVPCDASVSHWP
jgi:asparagine synthetase B (glutamine-hydrolysing)